MGRPRLDISGQTYGRLTAIRLVRVDCNSKCFWKFQCACGKMHIAALNNVRNSSVRSCGCLARDLTRERSTTHGHTKNGKRSPEWITWDGMLQRCYNPKHEAFFKYGGSGIRVCRRWRLSFSAFLQDVGYRPSPKHSLDRYPNKNKGYVPGNVRWATARQQTLNRSSTVWITHMGKTLCAKDWARRKKLKYSTMMAHLKKGISFSEILSGGITNDD